MAYSFNWKQKALYAAIVLFFLWMGVKVYAANVETRANQRTACITKAESLLVSVAAGDDQLAAALTSAAHKGAQDYCLSKF